MKNNKKGFTLIELLAVIAILAILVVIAVPAVLDLFSSSKASAFRTQTQTLLKAAEQQIVSDSIDPSKSIKSVYTNVGNDNNGSSALSLSGGSSVTYYVKVDTSTSTPKVSCIIVYDDSFQAVKKDPKISDFSDDTYIVASTYNSDTTAATLATACN